MVFKLEKIARMGYWIFIMLFATTFTYSFAQNGTIKGVVTDALSNEPISFANVLVLGADQGTTTDIKGDFEYRAYSRSL